MIKREIYLEKVDWKIEIYFDYVCDYRDIVIDNLKEAGISKKRLEGAIENLSACLYDTGLTYSSFANKRSVIVIGETSSAKEFLKTYHHELGHAQTNICQYYDISPYGEDIQYVGQDIVDKTWDLAKEFLCDCCRGGER